MHFHKKCISQSCTLNIIRYKEILRLGASHSKPLQTPTIALVKTRMVVLRETLRETLREQLRRNEGSWGGPSKY